MKWTGVVVRNMVELIKVEILRFPSNTKYYFAELTQVEGKYDQVFCNPHLSDYFFAQSWRPSQFRIDFGLVDR